MSGIMNIADFITPDRTVANIAAVDKPRLLAELARWAAAATGLPAPDIQEALTAREKLGSTGVGGGVAIPHARLTGLDRFYGLFARLDRPVDFDAIDEQPVDLVCLLLAPQNAAKDHLQALAAVSRRLHTRHMGDRLRKAPDAAALHALLIGEEVK